ncbi:MAG: Fic family protein [Opitutales bacterium]|jgi:Fic family protein|nr:Fic family protein [Opitutales bacterium]MBT5816418.1 Fic family protein [Opitutales bacterium]
MEYNWQQADWPSFRFDFSRIEGALFAFADKAGQINGMLKGLPDAAQTEAILQIMIAEALKTSEIEGEYLSRQDVMSSMRNQLGLNNPLERIKDKASEGAAELMVAVRDAWDKPLDETMLLSWHGMLMKGASGINAGDWRTDEAAMQIVSNPYGKVRIHFEAPPSSRVPDEMEGFISWFNQSEQAIAHAPVRAAIAHLYFESIHPFEDGNGRIGRAISEKAISQGLGRPAVLSLSRTIEANKKQYYDALEQAQKTNEISSWIQYFVEIVLVAQVDAEQQVEFVLRKTKFFDRIKNDLNKRQLKVVGRMLDEGPDGFEGGMNARKYISITKTSKATATRDLQKLVEIGVFEPVGGGRSTRYRLCL